MLRRLLLLRHVEGQTRIIDVAWFGELLFGTWLLVDLLRVHLQLLWLLLLLLLVVRHVVEGLTLLKLMTRIEVNADFVIHSRDIM